MKRAAEEETDDSSARSIKRIRVDENHPTASFDDLNNDCLVLILSSLSNEDMNNVAICSQRCREARAHDSLDQTRTGTIICNETTTLWSIRNAFVRREWNRIFTGNRTRLKVVGLERMPAIEQDVEQSPNHMLPNVSSLDLSHNSFAGDYDDHNGNKAMAFAVMLPNLEEIDLSHTIHFSRRGYVVEISRVCTHLRRVIWNASKSGIMMNGRHLPDAVAEAYLDNSELWFVPSRAMLMHSDAQLWADLFSRCFHLERLSIKNIRWHDVNWETSQPVTQEMLIKMVRDHPTLRWLRSDLSEENVAMLQKEKPEITFVS